MSPTLARESFNSSSPALTIESVVRDILDAGVLPASVTRASGVPRANVRKTWGEQWWDLWETKNRRNLIRQPLNELRDAETTLVRMLQDVQRIIKDREAGDQDL